MKPRKSLEDKAIAIRAKSGLVIFDQRCKTCKLVNRLEIERDFLTYRFNSVSNLCVHYQLPYQSVLAHLHHADLFAKRDADLIGQLRHIRREAYRNGVEFTGDHVLKSIKLESELTGQKAVGNNTVVNLIQVLSSSNQDSIAEIADVEISTGDGDD